LNVKLPTETQLLENSADSCTSLLERKKIAAAEAKVEIMKLGYVLILALYLINAVFST